MHEATRDAWEIPWREWRHRDPRVRGLRLASLAARHALLQVVTLPPESYTGRLRVEVDLERLAAVCAPREDERPAEEAPRRLDGPASGSPRYLRRMPLPLRRGTSVYKRTHSLALWLEGCIRPRYE
jgi:hypothetical protein